LLTIAQRSVKNVDSTQIVAPAGLEGDMTSLSCIGLIMQIYTNEALH
jgi:hypothetical protein